MRAPAARLAVVVVLGVLAVSVVVGLTEPDGTVGATVPASRSLPTPAATSIAPEASADRAPARFAPVGPFDCTTLDVEPTAAARSTFSDSDIDDATCAAVSFVLDQRYSRGSLPQREYDVEDFDRVLPLIGRATVDASYRARIAEFVDSPSALAAERLGLILLTGPPDATHVFYGPASSDAGYVDRAVWVDQHVSTVAVGLDTTKATPRLQVTFDAGAAMPVLDTRAKADALMTIDTGATLTMRRDDGSWRVGGWTMTTGDPRFALAR